MPDTFGTEQYCIVQFFIISRVTLARMQIHLKFTSHSGLCRKHLLDESIDRVIVVLFIHHVKANDKLASN